MAVKKEEKVVKMAVKKEEKVVKMAVEKEEKVVKKEVVDNMKIVVINGKEYVETKIGNETFLDLK